VKNSGATAIKFDSAQSRNTAIQACFLPQWR
jgi:hypothetical protein